MEGATEKWNQWEPTEMDDRKKDGGVHTKRKGFGLLGCRAVGSEAGLQGAHFWAGVDVSGSKAE